MENLWNRLKLKDQIMQTNWNQILRFNKLISHRKKVRTKRYYKSSVALLNSLNKILVEQGL